jgi:hypothetical protein
MRGLPTSVFRAFFAALFTRLNGQKHDHELVERVEPERCTE